MDLRLLRYFVTVAEEGNIGRAAARLHMTQPPLSRAVRQLEDQLGASLFTRTPHGVTPTAAGEALLADAQSLLQQADLVHEHVAAAAGTPMLRLGTLGDTADHTGTDLVRAFRRRHPGVDVRVVESDLSDPTAGLRAERVDVALTRTPFTSDGLTLQPLRSVRVGVVVRRDDPLAELPSTATTDLRNRTWIRLPEGTDPVWAEFWTGGGAAEQPAVRTIGECVQSVRWNGALAIAPLDQPLPGDLAVVPLEDRPPTEIVLAWSGSVNPWLTIRRAST